MVITPILGDTLKEIVCFVKYLLLAAIVLPPMRLFVNQREKYEKQTS